MSELIADLFISLDGFAYGEDFGPYFGYGGPDLDRWIDDHLTKPQEIVLGRRTYEVLAPIAAAANDPMQRRLTETPKLVVSSTLEEPLDWDNTRLLRGDATETLARARRESTVPLRVIGSISVVKSLIHAGILDRLRLTVFPLMVGLRGGDPLFTDLPTRHLTLESTEVLDGRLVSVEYRIGPSTLQQPA
jgi:dihydrofolate reductase